MTREELEAELRKRAPSDESGRERWNAAVTRLLRDTTIPLELEELSSRLPPKPAYLGPGPWLDAIRDAHRP